MRAIVVGIDGLIGAALVEALARRGNDVFGTTRRPENVIRGKIGLLDFSALAVDPELPFADVAFICAAMTNIAECRRDPESSEQINFRSPVLLAEMLVRRGTRTIFLSSNAVFDCLEPAVPADSPRRPRSRYGYDKMRAEEAVLALEQTVVRLTKVLTPDQPLIRRWAQAALAGQTVDAVVDHHLAPISLDHIVNSLLAVADAKEAGVFQVSSCRDLSYVAVASRIMQLLGRPVEAVNARTAAEIGIPPDQVFAHSSLEAIRLSRLMAMSAPEPEVAIDDATRRAVTAMRP